MASATECCRACLKTCTPELPLQLLMPNHNDDNDAVAIINYLDCFELCTGLRMPPSPSTPDANTTTTFTPPKTICTPCLNELQKAYAFRQLCIRSDAQLRARWQDEEDAEAKAKNADGGIDFIVEILDDVADDGLNDIHVEDTEMLDDEVLGMVEEEEWILESVEEGVDGDLQTEDNNEYIHDDQQDNEDVVYTPDIFQVLDEPTILPDNDHDDDDVETIILKTNVKCHVKVYGAIGAQLECDYCGRMFITKPALLGHMRQEHLLLLKSSE